MLTIVGYSINATIVIFDRIRENLQEANGQEEIPLRRGKLQVSLRLLPEVSILPSRLSSW